MKHELIFFSFLERQQSCCIVYKQVFENRWISSSSWSWELVSVFEKNEEVNLLYICHQHWVFVCLFVFLLNFKDTMQLLLGGGKAHLKKMSIKYIWNSRRLSNFLCIVKLQQYFNGTYKYFFITERIFLITKLYLAIIVSCLQIGPWYCVLSHRRLCVCVCVLARVCVYIFLFLSFFLEIL